jgi:RNA polymerase sigma-70 factor (ECF subfamily)
VSEPEAKPDFENTVFLYTPYLKNWAYVLTHNREDALDLLQDTLLKAYRFWDTLEPETNYKAWLSRIMLNSFINDYRKKKHQPEKVEFNDELVGIIPRSLDSSANLQETLSDEVYDALYRIQEDFREVLILCDIDGLTYEEISEALGIPVGTVRSRLHRARQWLQKELGYFAERHKLIPRPIE